MTDLTLGKKITLLTTVGLLLGVVVFGIFSSLGIRAVNQATETMLQDRMTTAHLVADYLDEALGRALAELKNTARMIETDGAESELESQVAALESIFSRLSIYTHSIYLFDQRGQMVWSKPGALKLDGIDVSAYPIISQTVSSGEPGISGLVSAPVTNVPVVLLASPTGEGQQAGKGVLIVAIDLAQSSIGGFIQPIRLGETGYVEIVDEAGIVVTRTEPGPKLAPFEQSDHSGRFAALISAGQPTRGVCHTCHEQEQKVARRDVLAFVPLSQARWGVVIRQSEEEALSPVQGLRQNLLFSGVGLLAIALLFVVITTRDVGSRIRMLTSASQKIAEGDLTSPVAALGKDEIGILAQTLDEMRAKLKASHGELEHKTKELASLLSVSEILTSTHDLPRLLEVVVAKVAEVITSADGALLLLQDAEHGGILARCAVGLDEGFVSQLLFTLGSRSSSAISAEVVSGEDKDTVKEFVTAFLQSDTWRAKVPSSISADVFHRNRHIGSLIIVNLRAADVFSEPDYHLLQAITDHISIAIERVQLSEEAEEAKALQEADRLRSQFISSVSHELRTPLTLIKGYSTSLLRQDVSWNEETVREFLQVIDEKTDELRDLIDKLLQSAKLEAGALKLEKEPLLLPRLARRVVEESALRAKKHKFTLEFAPSFPVIEADVRCIEQVVRNLVENAVKYSPEGGEVGITGEVKDGKVVVCVSDEGVGIPPEQQQKVFERFYRVDNRLTRGTPGSGLGLSIAKGHVEAHGGEVWVESMVGKGSKFYFSLPFDHTPTEN